MRRARRVFRAHRRAASDLVLLVRHIFPNRLSPVIVQASFVFAAAVLSEAALSFLGVGVPPFIPSWATSFRKGGST